MNITILKKSNRNINLKHKISEKEILEDKLLLMKRKAKELLRSIPKENKHNMEIKKILTDLIFSINTLTVKITNWDQGN